MSFFKKVNDTDDKPKSGSSDDKNLSYSDVNTEISDLDSLLDKVLAEKKAERPTPSPDGEIHSVKAADLLKGKTSSPESEEPEPVVINEEEPEPVEDKPEEEPEDTYSADDSYSALLEHEAEKSAMEDSSSDSDLTLTGSDQNDSAADYLGDDTRDTGSAASILADETPYESSADEVLSGTSESKEPVDEPVHEESAPVTSPEYNEDYTASGSDASDNTEDALLVQIDAFRDKAIRLSGLISANQKKVASLEAEVKKKEGQISDKESQIAALQDELSKKQKEADALVTTVETQVDRMLVSVKHEMSSLNNDISDKISRENKEESAKIAGVMDKVNSSVLEIKEFLAHSQEDTSLDDMKEELSEKIHSENVKVYRNLQDTMKEMDHSEQLDISLDEKYRSLKHRSIFMLIVLILNLGVSAVMLLMRLGIIPENILSLLGL